MTLLALRFAARELRSGVKGFRIFLACLALGVAAIAAAGSTAEASRQGLASQAREILGGDLAVTVEQRLFDPTERQAIEATGKTAWAVAARAMAQAPSGERRLVELRGVSEAYPLAGQVTLEGGGGLAQALAPQGGVAGAVVERVLLDRLGLKIGDHILVGELPLIVRGVLVQEPDRLSRGFALGPRVMVRRQAVEAGGFLQPGLQFVETARIALPDGVSPTQARKALRKVIEDSGVRMRDREDAAPGIRWLIDQLEYFLGFIGLASLVAGGLGVFGAVTAFLEERKPAIAVLKALGAEGAFIRNLYLAQIGVLALLGVAIGLVLGAAAPFVLGGLIPDDLPVPALFALYPGPLIRAGAFGLLSAAAFSLVPLARARATPPASLFRRDVQGGLKLSVETVGAAIAGLALAALSVLTAPTPLAAGLMIGGVAVSFVLLWGLGLLAAKAAGRLRAGTRGSLRMGLANLAGPRSAARTAAPAIGLGVGLLASVVLIQSSLLRQVAEVAPKTAPAMVFTEIPGARAAEFDRVVGAAFGEKLTVDNYLRAPFLTGRVVALNGKPVDRKAIAEKERWAYDNDISISAIGAEPPSAQVIEGRWWPAAYSGAPLLAMEIDAAKAGGLKVGDTVTLQVLGREIEAKLAVLRKVDVGGFGASFPLVLTPSALEGAELRHVAIAKGDKAQETRVTQALGRDFPEVNVISVREQLEAATDLFDRLALAIRGAAAVAALAGLLVLTGAIAARAQARTREASILKVLGASRLQIISAYVLEYGAVGVIAGLTGVALGCLAAWPVVTLVFKADWAVDWTGVAALVGGAAVMAGLGGVLASLHALAKRPAAALRAE
ncbi:MAG: FtsX-like permease family protein [Phenylobacterium sp.]|uniref:ABC transporter permease n=1 Tax=Phenylobacterium sp. TaxID=1871053 RepID=UPI0027200ADD|nr:FtsX-like permease family protein [Phenylobacterium sp.]MDO9430305.1 FtsX-like permease family protein [Phenylobacterium sp.]